MDFVKMHGLKNDYIFFIITPDTTDEVFDRLIRLFNINYIWSSLIFIAQNFKIDVQTIRFYFPIFYQVFVNQDFEKIKFFGEDFFGTLKFSDQN